MERVVDSFNKLFIFLVGNLEPFLLILYFFFTFSECIAYHFMDVNCGFQRKYVLKNKNKKLVLRIMQFKKKKIF